MGRFANIDTRDPAVNVTNWLLIVIAGLSVLIRLATKLWIFHQLTSDDYLMIAAFVRPPTSHTSRTEQNQSLTFTAL